MYISLKYLILYCGAGLATGYFSKGDKTALLVGMGIAALLGTSFGVSYAIVSGIEFAVGFGVAVVLRGDKKGDPGP